MLVCIKTFGRLLYSEETRVLTGWERYRCNLNWEAGRRHILFFGFVFFVFLCASVSFDFLEVYMYGSGG